ncbi:hypothetical protein CYMTET_51207 [Cymbomonas tetramitiformis]|uniref:Uncharacterized protein n=1 Tax=Cymbomonas tetramitiformis TaxID=36881 RepID=A0AAE0BN23_9CHLO|nr:hypothetical protein CYMTET_51207 [Cymbomonas tetramitiformis]
MAATSLSQSLANLSMSGTAAPSLGRTNPVRVSGACTPRHLPRSTLIVEAARQSRGGTTKIKAGAKRGTQRVAKGSAKRGTKRTSAAPKGKGLAAKGVDDFKKSKLPTGVLIAGAIPLFGFVGFTAFLTADSLTPTVGEVVEAPAREQKPAPVEAPKPLAAPSPSTPAPPPAPPPPPPSMPVTSRQLQRLPLSPLRQLHLPLSPLRPAPTCPCHPLHLLPHPPLSHLPPAAPTPAPVTPAPTPTPAPVTTPAENEEESSSSSLALVAGGVLLAVAAAVASGNQDGDTSDPIAPAAAEEPKAKEKVWPASSSEADLGARIADRQAWIEKHRKSG